MQTIATVLNAVKTFSKSAEPSPTLKEKGITFHQNQLANKIADPDNRDYAHAKALGLARASSFLKSATNPSDKDHESSLDLFKDKYDMDARKVNEDFVDLACTELDAHEYEVQDLGYEQNLFKKYKPSGNLTHEKLAFFENFQNAMREKWDKAGYRGDKKFVEDYVDKYGLEADNNNVDLKAFQSKQ